MKLVSIIIPTFGGGQFLDRALNSIFHQTYSNYEIIVVDDNGIGTPNQIKTSVIIDKYLSDERFKYICHKVNINGSAARNTGFKHSQGEYITLLDDDDAYTPEKIALQVNDLDSLDDSYALTYCSKGIYKNELKVRESRVHYSGNVFYEVMLHKAAISSSCLMVRRKVWEEMNGFDESFKRHQDYEFVARIAFKYKVHALDFIGHIHYVEQRNSPKDATQAVAYRRHYLNKMQPYINTLNKSQQKDIIIYNMLEAILQYVKHKQYYSFITEYISLHPGVRGIQYILKRIFN